MIPMTIFGFLVAAVFGLRFKVLVVMPLTVIGTLVTGVVSLCLKRDFGATFLSILTFAAAIQVGYLFGSFTRFTLAAMRASRSFPSRGPLKTAHHLNKIGT